MGVIIMKPTKTKLSIAITIFIAFTWVLASTASLAEQKRFKVSGVITAAEIHSAGVHIDDLEGHNMTLEEGEGTNKSTGAHEIMDGAPVTVFGTSDHVMGNGTGYGYAKLSMGDDVIFMKHEGTVETKAPTQGIRNTTFKGTFSFYKGLGRYKNIQGTGTYRGQYISNRIYTVEWEGQYLIAK